MKKRFNILVSGFGGQGIRTFSDLFSKIILRSGYHVFSFYDYTTKLKGGRNAALISISSEKIFHLEEDIDLMVALSGEPIPKYSGMLSKSGLSLEIGEDKDLSGKVLTLPLLKLAIGAGHRKYLNTVLLGAILGILKLDIQSINEPFLREFSRKGVEVYNENLHAAQNGYRLTIDDDYITPPEFDSTQSRFLVDGCKSIIFGTVGAGCQALFTNPLPINRKFLDFMNEFTGEFPIITDASESDSIAIFKALGANYAGLKSMVVGTSYGLQNMIEGISFSGMSEIPLVITIVQSPGPSVGMPTKTEQNNLFNLIFAGNDEFPRVIYAPSDHNECYTYTHKAFEVSSNYNLPVIILIDHFLADTITDVKLFDLDEVRRPRDHFTRKQLDKIKEYQTYEVTKSGVSPRLYPAQTKLPVIMNSYEHDETGRITNDHGERIKQLEKRNRKGESVLSEYIPPEFYGKEKFDILLVGWGSTIHSIKKSIDHLNKEGHKAGALLFRQVFPINPKKIKKYFKRTKFIVVIENNYTGQLGQLLRMVGGVDFNRSILRYDGFPITSSYILTEFNKLKKK